MTVNVLGMMAEVKEKFEKVLGKYAPPHVSGFWMKGPSEGL